MPVNESKDQPSEAAAATASHDLYNVKLPCICQDEERQLALCIFALYLTHLHQGLSAASCPDLGTVNQHEPLHKNCQFGRRHKKSCR